MNTFKKLKPSKKIIYLDDLDDLENTKKFRAQRTEIQDIMRSFYPKLNLNLKKDEYKRLMSDIKNNLKELFDELSNLRLDLREFNELDLRYLDLYEGEDIDSPYDQERTYRQYRDDLIKEISDTEKKIENLLLEREQYRALSDINRLNIVAQEKRLRKSKKHLKNVL